MSAVVCGKRAFFEDLPSPPISKRARCSSSPIRISSSPSGSPQVAESPSSPSSSLLLDHLISLFPDMDEKILGRALDDCHSDLDSAIKSLNELRLRCGDNHLYPATATQSDTPQTTDLPEVTTNEHTISPEDASAPTNLPKDGTEWVELFVKEMLSATNLDDARLRAARALEALEKSICVNFGGEHLQKLQQENAMMKEQMQVILHENTILKRAVSIQHERQKESEVKALEVQQLKQLIPQYQEQLRTLEVNNYALTMHLKQAQQNSSIPNRFHPDVL